MIKPSHKLLEYDDLLRQGMEIIERQSHKKWTDYNVHDPGITTLEILCYYLTQLTLSASLDIKNLIAENSGADQTSRPEEYESLYPAHQILPICPFSEDDYRKLLLDIWGVRRAWIHLAENPKGYYKVYTHISGLNFSPEKPRFFQPSTPTANKHRPVEELARETRTLRR